MHTKGDLQVTMKMSGDRWWTVKDAMKEMNCGYSTARIALRDLAVEGVLIKRQRPGSAIITEYKYKSQVPASL